MWDVTGDLQVRAQIVQIRFGEYADKRELLEQIRTRVQDPSITSVAREKLAMMLRCFLHPEQPDVLKLQTVQLLLFNIADSESRLAALEYLATYLETRNLNYAEQGSIATVIESLLNEKHLGEAVREKGRYLLFIADPKRLSSENDQKSLLSYLRGIAEGEGFVTKSAENRVLDALSTFSGMVIPNENLKKAAQYLEFKIKNPRSPATWDRISAA